MTGDHHHQDYVLATTRDAGGDQQRKGTTTTTTTSGREVLAQKGPSPTRATVMMNPPPCPLPCPNPHPPDSRGGRGHECESSSSSSSSKLLLELPEEKNGHTCCGSDMRLTVINVNFITIFTLLLGLGIISKSIKTWKEEKETMDDSSQNEIYNDNHQQTSLVLHRLHQNAIISIIRMMGSSIGIFGAWYRYTSSILLVGICGMIHIGNFILVVFILQPAMIGSGIISCFVAYPHIMYVCEEVGRTRRRRNYVSPTDTTTYHNHEKEEQSCYGV